MISQTGCKVLREYAQDTLRLGLRSRLLYWKEGLHRVKIGRSGEPGLRPVYPNEQTQRRARGTAATGEQVTCADRCVIVQPVR